MYVQGYQIENVLNVYRKQLSQKTRTQISSPVMPAAPAPEKGTLAADDKKNNQRRAILEQISADIFSRIEKYSHQNRFGTGGGELCESVGNVDQIAKPQNETEFTYTFIDENNNKQTNVMQISGGTPIASDPGQSIDDMNDWQQSG